MNTIFHRRIAFACALVLLAASHGANAAPRTVAEYRGHLEVLESLVAQCEHQTDLAHCNPDAVGPDDQVDVPGWKEPRRISYAWLRSTLGDAGVHTFAAEETGRLLETATERLHEEDAGAAKIAEAAPSYTSQSKILIGILDQNEFQRREPSLMASAMDTVRLWVYRALVRAAGYSAHRRWLAFLMEWGLVALVCLGFGLWWLRITRRRGRMAAPAPARDANAAALRPWERLHQEAEQAADEMRWRDAIHAYYWAAVARFEQHGQWPVDRARTPRESLRLIAPARWDALAGLTRMLERCWYGSGMATEFDCEAARGWFERLAER